MLLLTYVAKSDVERDYVKLQILGNYDGQKIALGLSRQCDDSFHCLEGIPKTLTDFKRAITDSVLTVIENHPQYYGIDFSNFVSSEYLKDVKATIFDRIIQMNKHRDIKFHFVEWTSKLHVNASKKLKREIAAFLLVSQSNGFPTELAKMIICCLDDLHAHCQILKIQER